MNGQRLEATSGTKGLRKKRRSRSVPYMAATVRLTERDVSVFSALLRTRFLSTSLVALLFFGNSRWAANKSLRRLLNAGYVKVWVRSLTLDNVYSLTRRGLDALAIDDLDNPRSKTAAPRRLDGNLDHLLMLNRVRIMLALSLPACGGEIISWRSDWEMPRLRHGVAPDAIFSLRWDRERERTFCLEVDHRTRNHRRFLEKILRYRSLQYGTVLGDSTADLSILVVGEDPVWIERYRRVLAATGLQAPVWFTTVADLNMSGALGAIWHSSDCDRAHSLRTGGSLPCGKEDRDRGAVVMAPTCTAAAARPWT